MTQLHHTHHLQALYHATAPSYHATIAPVMRALSAHLVRRLQPWCGGCALDIGAGTGSIARIAAENGCFVTGVDISEAMVRTAQQHTARSSCFLVADAHALPFAANAFDLAFAVFAFNETDPAAAFAEVRRVLRPGGRLALLEWGPVDWLMALLDETLATHATETASGFQAEMRAMAAAHRPWDDAVSNCGDIAKILQDAGFVSAACEFIRAAVTFAAPDDFINYAIAWAPRRAEVEAMSPAARDSFFCELRGRLGKPPLIWRPRLFYAAAAAPAGA